MLKSRSCRSFNSHLPLLRAIHHVRHHENVRMLTTPTPFMPRQVSDSLSVGGGANLNDVSLLGNCGILVALAVFWRLVHYVILKRSVF